MTMTRKRQILNCLKKSYLYEIAKDYEISGAYRLNAGDLVGALSRKPSVKIEEILNDLSLQEISEILDLPVGTVKSRLFYGRKALKKKLESDGRGLREVQYEFT